MSQALVPELYRNTSLLKAISSLNVLDIKLKVFQLNMYVRAILMAQEYWLVFQRGRGFQDDSISQKSKSLFCPPKTLHTWCTITHTDKILIQSKTMKILAKKKCHQQQSISCICWEKHQGTHQFIWYQWCQEDRTHYTRHHGAHLQFQDLLQVKTVEFKASLYYRTRPFLKNKPKLKLTCLHMFMCTVCTGTYVYTNRSQWLHVCTCSCVLCAQAHMYTHLLIFTKKH